MVCAEAPTESVVSLHPIDHWKGNIAFERNIDLEMIGIKLFEIKHFQLKQPKQVLWFPI